MKTAYKFLRTGMKSNYDGSPWVMDKWRTVPAPTMECVGLNCSRMIADALGYVRGEILAKVEYRGEVIDAHTKLTCGGMRVVKAWKWDKMISVKVAVFSARHVLPLYEKANPTDKRPREAIEAAEAWIKRPTKKNAAACSAKAANSAKAAKATNSAAAAAYAAADSAYAAYAAAAAYAASAYAAAAAYAAASDAASAYAAAYSASDAAYAAADSAALKQKVQRYILSLLVEQEGAGRRKG